MRLLPSHDYAASSAPMRIHERQNHQSDTGQPIPRQPDFQLRVEIIVERHQSGAENHA